MSGGRVGEANGTVGPVEFGSDERIERRLVWLMFGRLTLSILSFGIAIGLDGFGPELSEGARRGLYWSVAFAFLATVLSGAWLGRIRDAHRFALFQIGIDVAIVTSLVQFSGGRESVFVFLYALVTMYGALLFERRGAIVGAGFSAVGYGLALLAANEGGLFGFEIASQRVDPARLLGGWAVHASALFLVGTLASVLASELYRTGQALDERTSDLHLLRDLHRRTVESLMSGLLTTDLNGVVTSFNPEAERILEVDVDAAIGHTIDDIIPSARELVMCDQGAGRAENHLRSRISHETVSGETIFLGLAGSSLKNMDGSGIGHIVIFQDVTKVVAMEDDLRRSERLAAVGEMSAKMAHEIRNPLAAISGSIQLLEETHEPAVKDSERGRLMNIVLHETDRLSALIEDFLQYSRPGPLLRKAVDLSELAGDVVKAFTTTLPEGVSVEMRLDDPAVAFVDSNQMRQVVWNLCINGVQAMPDGGVLRVETRQVRGSGGEVGVTQGAGANRRSESGIRDATELVERSWVELIVEDSGLGMPEEIQERVFEPFFTTKERGSGLGLATVHRIVESHGGSLELDSVVEKGTRIALCFPCHGEDS